MRWRIRKKEGGEEGSMRGGSERRDRLLGCRGPGERGEEIRGQLTTFSISRSRTYLHSRKFLSVVVENL